MAGRDTLARRLASDVLRSYLSMIPALALVGGVFLWAYTAPHGLDALALVDILQASLLFAWAVWCVAYIVLIVVAFGTLSSAGLRDAMTAGAPPTRWAARLGWYINGGGAVSWALAGSLIATGTVVALAFAAVRPSMLQTVASIAVLVATAAVIAAAFTVQYARTWALSGGVDFPRTPKPRLTDFAYLAIQGSTSLGTNDVVITTTRMRRNVATQSCIAFVFNTVVVAILVSTILQNAG